MKLAQWILSTPIGPLHLVSSEQGLRGIYWKKQSAPLLGSLRESNPQAKTLAQAVRELEEYFAGKRKEFEVPLDLEGTEFQKKVWNRLRRIPYGETTSYTAIARQIRHDKAVRAVGTANGRNHFPILIPCHRVIASNGTLAGYAGGLAVKEKLLALERGEKI